MLANHRWSVAGESDRAEVNATFVQPFVTYTTKMFTTVGVTTETTYDWENAQGTVPTQRVRAAVVQDRPAASGLPTRGALLRRETRWRSLTGACASS